MKLILSIVVLVCAVILLMCGIVLLVRKGKPITSRRINYRTEEERIASERALFIMGQLCSFNR